MSDSEYVTESDGGKTRTLSYGFDFEYSTEDEDEENEENDDDNGKDDDKKKKDAVKDAATSTGNSSEEKKKRSCVSLCDDFFSPYMTLRLIALFICPFVCGGPSVPPTRS